MRIRIGTLRPRWHSSCTRFSDVGHITCKPQSGATDRLTLPLRQRLRITPLPGRDALLTLSETPWAASPSRIDGAGDQGPKWRACHAPPQRTRPLPAFSSPNYTQVPDELLDALMASLSDAELQVLLYIIRRTFGFNQNVDAISQSQMVSGINTRDGRVLDSWTRLSKATMARGLKGLRDKQIILADRRSSAERGNESTTYRLRFKSDEPSQITPVS